MALAIEDYALIGDCHTAALVGKDGSIDWLCLPDFDSPSMFGALLGSEDQGRWLIAPVDATAQVTRSYEHETLVLVTRWTTDTGEVEVTDFMPYGDDRADLVRRVRGISGSVAMWQDLRIRFAYAAAIPWVRRSGDGLLAVAGSSSVIVHGPALKPRGKSHQGKFTVEAGQTVDFTLTWFPSHRRAPVRPDVEKALRHTRTWWMEWCAACSYDGPYHDFVARSLITLRALTHVETGGIVAAATTSLPEQFGGSRNWDYRYVWLRDASFTLSVLLRHGYTGAANHWREWLLRAVAGDPADVQIMYALNGDRYLAERELPSLPGYNGASPVRIGNGAYTQFQGDVIGEVMLALHETRMAGLDDSEFSWSLQRALMAYLEREGLRPDNGMWESRGTPRLFTESRVMSWVALDCAIRAVEQFGKPGPVDHWRTLRDQLHEEIESQGFDTERNTYTQYYGSGTVDASLLLLPQVGYCKPDDPRMLGTVNAIERELLVDGLPLRYRTESGIDGLPPGENPFLACAFWLAEQYASSGRLDNARELMERLLGYGNDVGLFSEEYDTRHRRQAGNTPQALTHLALVRAAEAIAAASVGATMPSRMHSRAS